MRAVIFGAGQAGFMVKTWLPSSYEVAAFADNNRDLWGENLDGTMIVSAEDAVSLNPDLFILAVLNKDALIQIRRQLEDLDFQNQVVDVDAFRGMQDIRLAGMRLYAGQIRSAGISGAVAELGVYKGEFASELNRCFPDRELYLLDTFTGFTEADMKTEERMNGSQRFRDFSDTGIEQVRKTLPNPDKVTFIKGYFPETASMIPEQEYAFVSLDPDLYAPTLAGLEYFWPRLSPGGVIFIHDYTGMQFPGVRQAVDHYCSKHDLMVIPLMDLHGTAVLFKQRGGV